VAPNFLAALSSGGSCPVPDSPQNTVTVRKPAAIQCTSAAIAWPSLMITASRAGANTFVSSWIHRHRVYTSASERSAQKMIKCLSLECEVNQARICAQGMTCKLGEIKAVPITLHVNAFSLYLWTCTAN
jgi:hypothetical protein